jgi:branched-subunit amino acid aminotransferase/4-amino-4-deoxychorismate lyase
LPDARVRLSVWKGQDETGLLVKADKYKPFSRAKYRQGFRLCLAPLRQNEDSFLARIKCMNNLLYQLSYQRAEDAGFDEALLLNSRGYIAECSRANIFLVKDGELLTPSLDCGCLGGITRAAVLDLARQHKIKSYENKFILSDLKAADEVFITNSLIGVMPVKYMEKIKVGASSRITRFMSGVYRGLCNTRK